MTRIKLQFVKSYVDNRDGRVYHYFRRRGFPRIRLPGLPGSAEFMAAYQMALHGPALPVGIKRSRPGTVAAAVAAFLVAPTFTSKRPATQAMWRSVLNRLRDEYGELAMWAMPPKFIRGLLDKRTPHAARSWLKTLRALCQFCVEAELLKIDPTAGMKLPRVPKSDGHHTWTDAEVAQFEAHHQIGSKARLALALGVFTMQRRSDVVRMGRQHIGTGDVIRASSVVIDRWLSLSQQKTGESVHLPVFPDLQVVLDATPSGHLSFLVTRSGQPYSPNDFSDQFRQWCIEAGLPNRCTFHGLRKYSAVWFAEAGCGAPEIAAWGGWKSLREVERYIREANKRKLARNAVIEVLAADAENKTARGVSGNSHPDTFSGASD
jgi:integrase